MFSQFSCFPNSYQMEEFVMGMLSGLGLGEQPDIPDNVQNEFLAAFNVIDHNKDGFISLEEMEAGDERLKNSQSEQNEKPIKEEL